MSSFTFCLHTLIMLSYALDNICDRNFHGITDRQCIEYGFCSSCVSNDCNWCQLTSTCMRSDKDCGPGNTHGLSTINECNTQYGSNKRENPNTFSTDYSPQIAEIMSTYSQYAEDITFNWSTNYTNYITFNLDIDSTEIFTGHTMGIMSSVTPPPIELLIQGLELLTDDPQLDVPSHYNYTIIAERISSLPDRVPENNLVDIIGGLFGATFDFNDVVNDLVDLLSDNGTVLLPQNNMFGENQVIVGLDTKLKGIIVSFRATDNEDTLKSEVLFHELEDWEIKLSNLTDLQLSFDVNIAVMMNEYFGATYKTLKNVVNENNMTFFELVTNWITQYSDYDLYVTGHSLGGALANIFVLDLYADYYRNDALSELDLSKIFIYTFGQPRVGNEGFAMLVNKIYNYRFYRVVNNNDIVSMIPPRSINYRHCGIEIHYGTGDNYDGRLCQYRECTYLDPYLDLSCATRFTHEIYFNEMFGKASYYPIGYIRNTFNRLQQFLSNVTNNTNTVDEGDWGAVIQLFESNGPIYAHSRYAELGQYGHCNKGHSSEVNVVKCNDYTASLDINTDNYQCIDWLNGFGNLFRNLDKKDKTIFSKLNGCYNAGDDMNCCLGAPRGPFMVCKEDTGLFHLSCPKNDVGDYCIDNSDCKNPLKCLDFLCRRKKTSERICSGYSDAKHDCEIISSEWNLKISTGGSRFAGTDSSIFFSYCINSVCSDFHKLDNCDHNDFKGKCINEYFIISDLNEDISEALSQNINAIDFQFVNCGIDALQIDQITVGHDGKFGIIDSFKSGQFKKCQFDNQPDTETTFVIDRNGKCKVASIIWDGPQLTTSRIFGELMTPSALLDYDDICSKNKKCSGTCDVKQSKRDTVDFTFTNYVIAGLTVLLLVATFLWNIMCWKDNFLRQTAKIKYDL